jgi:hypothetical protein
MSSIPLIAFDLNPPPPPPEPYMPSVPKGEFGIGNTPMDMQDASLYKDSSAKSSTLLDY